MENREIKIHYYQKDILKKLTLHPILRFNELMIEGLESEHMNYHLKQLILLGLVTRIENGYTLSDDGKDYCNLLDDQIEIVEKQPKTSIIVRGVRANSETGEVEHLLNRRLRQPYFGKVGRITGKVRFGEKLAEAAARELYEEAGLTAENFILEEVYHKIRYRENQTVVQDVIFYIFFVTKFQGSFIERSEFQENFWMTKKEFEARKDLDIYDDFNIDDRTTPYREIVYTETRELAEGF